MKINLNFLLFSVILNFTDLVYSQEINYNKIKDEIQKIDMSAKVTLTEEAYNRLSIGMYNTFLSYKTSDLVTLWKAKKDHYYFELLWFRIDDPNYRVYVLYLMQHGRDRGISSIPNFESYAKRYASPEKEQRLKEIQLANELLNVNK